MSMSLMKEIHTEPCLCICLLLLFQRDRFVWILALTHSSSTVSIVNFKALEFGKQVHPFHTLGSSHILQPQTLPRHGIH